MDRHQRGLTRILPECHGQGEELPISCGHRQPLAAGVPLLPCLTSRLWPSPAVGGRSCLHGFGLDPFGMHHSRKMVVAIADVGAGSHVTTDDGIVRCGIVEEVLAAM